MVKFSNKGKAKKSKRVTLQQKYKVERKIKEHHKKARRAAKKLQSQGLKKKAKLDVIPNLYPFKADLIHQQEQERLNKAIKIKERKANPPPPRQQVEELPRIVNELGCKRYVDYTDLIDAADVVVEVLDVRDVEACRNRDIEREIISSGKVLVLLLNKVELVPVDEAEAWRKHLQTSFPTVLFSAVKTEVSHINSLIKAVDSKLKDKETIKLGLIGYASLGKTTIVKSLTAQTFLTRSSVAYDRANEIQIGSNVFLLDATANVGANTPDSLLFNFGMENKLMVAALLKKVDKAYLRDLYKIPSFKKVEDFLEKVAKSQGKLNKGGIPNLQAAAKQVITDLRDNKIMFFNSVTQPQTQEAQ